MRIRFNSLRVQLVAATLLAGAVVLAAFSALHVAHMRDELDRQLEWRERLLRPLLNAALAAPLAQRDYATVDEILAEAQQKEGLAYLAVFDPEGRQVASRGLALRPPATPDGDRGAALPDDILERRMPVRVAGQDVGEAHFGLSTRFMRQARADLIRNELIFGLAALTASALLIGTLGWFLTRSLSTLTRGARRLGAGELALRMPETGQSEIATLARAFNVMAAALEARLNELRESTHRFHAIADYTHDLEIWLAPDGSLVWVNPSVRRLLGCNVEEALATPGFPLPFVLEDDRAMARDEMHNALKGTTGTDFEFRMVRRDGTRFWVSANWQPLYDETGRYRGIRASLRDISQARAVSQQLRSALNEIRHANMDARHHAEEAERERARLVALLSAMNLGILMVGSDNRAVYYNPAFLRIWMIADSPDLIGLPAQELVERSTGELSRPDHFSRHLLHVLETHESSEAFEVQMADGRVITQLAYPVRDPSGRFIGQLWVYEDVTHERRTAEQLAYLAERDSLTGLYNRFRFQQELARMISDCNRHKLRGALLFFDLDEFKVINDSFGHRAGDALLIRVAGEIASLTRKNEFLARLGGDEFALIVPNADEPEVTQIAERIVRSIASIPFRFEGQNLRLTTSVGIAWYPEQAADADDLVAHADAAMYRAKEAGKNTWRVWAEEASASRAMVERLTWNERIDHALEHNLLRLHFQGVYHCGDMRLSHLEALVRMIDQRDPARMIMPGHFIPVAEKSGKIRDIDRWVIGEAIRVLAAHPAMPPVAVNISGRSFDDPTLPQYIADTLARHAIEPRRLLVELTETSAVSDLADAQRFIEALHVTGCGICLDDFGSGFSSFAYLKHLAVDTVKIDGLFIRNLPFDPDNQVFVKAIADVARGLGKITVAEFVEDERTLSMLRGYGVDLVQGYHLDKPQAEHPALMR